MAVPIYEGCFSHSQPLVDQGYHKYQSSGWCAGVCDDINKTVLGLSNGTLCWCGNLLPPARAKVADSKCNTPCQGYDLENCGGGARFYTVWLTGTKQNVANFNPNSISSFATRSSTSSASTSTSSTRSSAAPTHHHTSASTTKGAPASPASTPHDAGAKVSAHHTKPGNKHDEIVGIVLGVVLGVLALAVLLFVLVCIHRRRKRTGLYFRRRTPTPDQERKESPDEPGIDDANESAISSAPNLGTEGAPATASYLAPSTLAPAFLSPSLRQASHATTGTSYEQPFYTPTEERSFYLDDAEPPAHAITSPTDTAEDAPPLPAMPQWVNSNQPTRSNNSNPHQNPFASTADQNLVDVGAGFMATNTEQSAPPVGYSRPRHELP